jgi:hypothetical protein
VASVKKLTSDVSFFAEAEVEDDPEMMEMLKMIEEAKDDLEVAEEQVDETIIAAKRLDSGANVWKNFRRNNGRENGVFCSILCPKN